MGLINEEALVSWNGATFSVWVSEVPGDISSFPIDPFPTGVSSAATGTASAVTARSSADSQCRPPSPPRVLQRTSPHASPLPMHGECLPNNFSPSPMAAVPIEAHNSNLVGPSSTFKFSSKALSSSFLGHSRKRPRRSHSPPAVSLSFIPKPTSKDFGPSRPPTHPTPTSIITSSPTLSPAFTEHHSTPASHPPSPPPNSASHTLTPPPNNSPPESTDLHLPLVAPALLSHPVPSPAIVSPTAPCVTDPEITETIKLGSALGFRIENSAEQIAALIHGERESHLSS